jgi:hypothetical protein
MARRFPRESVLAVMVDAAPRDPAIQRRHFGCRRKARPICPPGPVHYCVGALAPMRAAIAIGALVDGFPRMTLDPRGLFELTGHVEGQPLPLEAGMVCV